MKKKGSITAIICLAALVVFFIFQIILFRNSKLVSLNVTPHSTKSSQEKKNLALKDKSRPKESIQTRHTKISCDRSHNSYDICTINGPAILDPSTSTFFVMEPNWTTPQIERIRPYPRKLETFTMSRIKELTLTSGPSGPHCQVQHNAPALVFSAGGYTGNFFHDFNDGFIPLYITVNSVFNGQEFVPVISKSHGWWVSKYKDLIQSFTKHPIIHLDNDASTHCFPSANVGLISHGFMTINPELIPNNKTITHFHAFLDKAYSKRAQQYHHQNTSPSKTRPRLVLVGRTGATGRVLLNQQQVKKEAEKLGFNVIVFEPRAQTQLSSSYEVINSSHAMIGVHGAALTHSLFLRPGSVFIQVVPLGTEWVSEVCFGKPARDLGLEYMEYRTSVNESSLIEKYGKDDMVVKDPKSIIGKEWSNEIMDIYLKKQNVRLDLSRFGKFLKEAYRKSKTFLDKQG